MNNPVQEITIANRKIGPAHSPFIIAEMSGNHNHSLERAFELIDVAASSGAHALKLQTYTPDSLTIDYEKDEFFISDPDSLWKGESLYKLYEKAQTPYEWHKPIFDRCKEKNIICFSTPFDEKAVDLLEELGTPCYKIASFENTHLPLIKRVAMTKKPMIVSTGMASVAEIQDLVSCARSNGCDEIILLKCTSSYPASPEDSNIRTIPHMRDLFGTQVGLSDHTMGVGVAVASIALGATVIEKHFTLSRSDGGVDSAFSLEPHELASLVIETKRAWQGLGRVSYLVSNNEKKSLNFRRSIYVVEDIKAGEAFSEKNIRIIRPGLGLPPKYFEIILNKKAKINFSRGTPLRLEDVMVGDV